MYSLLAALTLMFSQTPSPLALSGWYSLSHICSSPLAFITVSNGPITALIRVFVASTVVFCKAWRWQWIIKDIRYDSWGRISIKRATFGKTGPKPKVDQPWCTSLYAAEGHGRFRRWKLADFASVAGIWGILGQKRGVKSGWLLQF